MRSSPLRKGAALLAAAAVAASLAGCASHPGSRSGALVKSDRWTPPAVSGPPSTASFCTVVVAAYQHLAQLPHAASLAVREHIVSDYVSLAPTMVAVAPPQVSAAARSYFPTVARVLTLLEGVGLDSRKLRPGQLAPTMSRQFAAASTAVIEFTQKNCHYSIGG